MGEFFKEVEFEMPESPAKPAAPPVVVWDPEILAEAVKRIEAEIEKIKNGTSEHSTYAVNPGDRGFPAMNAVKIFVADPSDRSFRGVSEILVQDFKVRAGTLFTALLKAARSEKEVNNAADN
jgi:hypothetical protein